MEMEMEIIRWFDEVTEDAGRTQTETLRRILEENCGVEYLRKYLGEGGGDQNPHLLLLSLLLNGKEDHSNSSSSSSSRLEDIYRKLVPLSSHSDFEPFIQRIADGDDTNPLLTLNPIPALSLSSGTTDGRQKLVPFTRHTTLTTFQIFSLASAYRSRVYPIREGKKALQLIYSSKQYKTKGGLTVGTATTHIYESEEFKNKSNYLSCSPQEVISSGDYRQSTYCHLLLGLFFRQDIDYITSTFSYSIVQALASFEDFFREICHDIRYGTLTNRITLPNVRKAVLQIIRPNPTLALEIEFLCNELEQLNWAGLIPSLWPNAKYVCSIMTGSMQPYTKKLRHYGGKLLPLVSADYGSTESWIGVNVDPSLPPEMVSFAVVPSFSYFEFIPVHKPDCLTISSPASCDHNQYLIEDEPVTLSQVKLGQQYELVLTTFTGLYRYRLGDIVEVSGFHKGTPKISFVCRRNLILTINIDKNTEKDLQLVVERASQVLSLSGGGELVDFTSHAVTADVANDERSGHYVVYWEIKGEVEDRVLEECCKEMDGSFLDHGYVVSRRCGSIGPLELRVVEGGTFKKILDYFVEKGGALSQFKTPRCTSNSVLLDILNAGTIRTFYSTAYN